MWGLHSKKTTIIGARTSNGKSALALQLAWDVAKQGIPVLFLSLEMYEEDVAERLFCMSQRIDNFELLTGKFNKYSIEWNNFKRETETMPLVITDMLGKTWTEIDTYLASLTKKPKVIIVDHLQEAKNASMINQKEVIDEYLKKLRILAIREDFALVICCQANRASQDDKADKAPQMHHLKNSGYIEESADIILLLHWPHHYDKEADKNKFKINVAKNRNGRTGWVDVFYKPEYYLFTEQLESNKPQVEAEW